MGAGSMSIASKLMTAEEFYVLPSDGVRRQLIEGRTYSMSPAGYAHGIATANICAAILLHARQFSLGRTFGAETGFVVGRNPDSVMAPDCAFVRTSRLHEVKTSRGFCGAHPDLVVEVISPTETKKEVVEKAQRWLGVGVEVVWVIDPEKRTATVYEHDLVTTLMEDKSLTAESLLPEFSIRIGELFDISDS
jgi:Uma2 family endonuclease